MAMLSRRPRLNHEDVNGLNENRNNKNRLFSLFAQNHCHRNGRFANHAEANNNHSLLKLDWNAFCSDLFSEPAHFSSWQRLSQCLIKHHKSTFVPPSKPLFDSKFKRSFNVAMSLTVRALTIKSVSSAIIATTQTMLYQQHLQAKLEARGHQIDLSVTESVPSSKQIRKSVLPVRHSASFPALPQRSQQARDHQLNTPLVTPTFMLSPKHFRRDAVAQLRVRSHPTLSKAKSI